MSVSCKTYFIEEMKSLRERSRKISQTNSLELTLLQILLYQYSILTIFIIYQI